MTETGMCQARQQEQMEIVIKENPFFKIKLSEYDCQYNGNEITYLFFVCGLVRNDPGPVVGDPCVSVCGLGLWWPGLSWTQARSLKEK